MVRSETPSRCYGCTQENCSSPQVHCYCWCHGEPAFNSPLVEASKRAEKLLVDACGPFPDLKCSVHRRYQAKRRPRVNCEACWRMYVANHPVSA